MVTGTRAEYGLLYWLMREIDEDPNLELQVIATGMHLSHEFGLTYKQIEADGFTINEKLEMLLSSDTPVGIAKSIGLGIIGFADAFARLKPDIVVLLGDRYEILAATQAAMTARIPIAHIHGGELTEGVIDDAIRHAVTKMSHIHFTSTEKYRERVIQLGEHPDKVFNFGAPGLDNIARLKLLSKGELESSLQFQLGKPTFLVTFHPVTLEADNRYFIDQLLEALDSFSNATIIFTKANADTNGRIINKMFEAYEQRHPNRVKVFTSLGQQRYLSCLKYVDVVVGNSSSGIIEAPLFKTPTVNIGDRQKGRLHGETVINCGYRAEEIKGAIYQALSEQFKQAVKQSTSIYGDGKASKNIKEVLKNINLNGILFKQFYDYKERVD